MSKERALFVVTNAATLTGFQLNLAIDHYNPAGQWIILLLTIAGTQFALIAGGIAVTRIARLPYSDGRVVLGSIIAHFVALGICLLASLRADQPIVAALIDAASAFGNSGVWMGQTPELIDTRTHALLLPLALLGGFGIPVLMDLIDALLGRRSLSNHTLAVLKLSAIVYLIAVATCFILQWPQTGEATRSALASSSALATNTRSAGLPIQFVADYPRYIQWVLILLMAIGAAPGGAGGGLKVTTLGKLCTGICDTLAGRNPGRIFAIAVVWLVGFVALIFLSLLLLLWTEPGLDADRILFIATSAAANAGLSHDRVGIAGSGLHVLTLTMLLGRLLPLGILWWVLRHADETDVAIG